MADPPHPMRTVVMTVILVAWSAVLAGSIAAVWGDPKFAEKIIDQLPVYFWAVPPGVFGFLFKDLPLPFLNNTATPTPAPPPDSENPR